MRAVFLSEDDLWGKDVWLPAAVAAGHKRMAVVTADTVLGKAQLEQFAQEIDNHGLAMRKFDSVAAATT
ncbi:MAG: hypothetical protein WB682_05275 [Candidatus Dormiibacterota bacterium]